MAEERDELAKAVLERMAQDNADIEYRISKAYWAIRQLAYAIIGLAIGVLLTMTVIWLRTWGR
jgi:hypothetical protein